METQSTVEYETDAAPWAAKTPAGKLMFCNTREEATELARTTGGRLMRLFSTYDRQDGRKFALYI